MRRKDRQNRGRPPKKLMAAACIGTLLFAGCGSTLPDMTDDQVNAVGEYAAMTLLKYDANSKSRLVDVSLLTEPEVQETIPVVPQPEITQPEQPEDTEQTVIDRTEGQDEAVSASLEEFLALPEGLLLTYSGDEVTQSYQEEGDLYFALEASAGKQLLILKFDMVNQSGADQEIRFIDQQNSYRVTVNEDYTRTALTTMLDNDMATFMGNIRAGESRTLVLLYEIDLDKLQQVDSLTIKFKNRETSYTSDVL